VKTNNPETLATLGSQYIRRSPYNLCTQCCQFLWIVCLHLMSCLPNVSSFSGLVVFTLCLVYPMLPASLDCLHPEKPATLGTQDIRRRQSIQRNWQHSVHKKKDEEKQSTETGNIVYTRHSLRLMSCVPNVASFSGLFVFALCLVYLMLPVSLDCLSSPYVLCTQCCQFLWFGQH
jgi:hypothetical protein